MELEQLLSQVAEAIRSKIDLPEFHAGKFSMWLKFVRPVITEDGTRMEESVGGLQKLVFTAGSFDELLLHVAENAVLAVYGAELPVVKELPNLIVKLIDRKSFVPVPGGPPVDQAGQVFLKATVYRYEPSLWEQIFGRKQEA